MENIDASKYLKELKKRAKKSKVYYKYQLTGLIIADLLNDKKHKSLYIKLAKEINDDKILEIAKDIASNEKIKNKGAYFMWELKNKNLIKPKNKLINKKNVRTKKL
jgi:hypothetical protein